MNICENPDFLRVVYFTKLILDIILTVVPLGLVVMIIIDFSKSVISSDEGAAKKSSKLAGKRIFSCLLVFLTPWIVSLLFGILRNLNLDLGEDYQACLNIREINTDVINKYQALAEEKEKEEKEAREKAWQETIKNNSNVSGNSASGSSSGSGNSNHGYSDLATRMVKLAEGELGKTDGTKYGAGKGQAWCAYFTIWVLKNTDTGNGKSIFTEKIGSVYSEGAAGGSLYAFYSKNNLKFYYSKYYGGTYTPKAGDVIYFRFLDGNHSHSGGVWPKIQPDMYSDIDHVGIVKEVVHGSVTTIEGNHNKKVGTRTISLDSNMIAGYGSWYNN